MKREVAIVGGGISGLATAYGLRKRFPARTVKLTLLEASSRLGGTLVSDRLGGFLFEGGPDSFVAKKPQAEALCRELGLGEDLIESRPSHRGAWIWWEGRLHPFPMGVFMKAPIPVSALLQGSLLSEAGRRRVLEEGLAPTSGLEDESVADFIGRRLGGEVLQRLVEPLVAGVYGGQADLVSARFAFPALFAHERRHGRITSQLGDSIQQEGSSPFISLKNGVESLSVALIKALGGRLEIRLNSPVREIRRQGRRFVLAAQGGEPVSVDAVVLATPATVSAALLSRQWPELATALGGIDATPSIVGCFGYRGDVTAGRSGTGALIPPAAAGSLLACTWVHQKFDARCPPNGSQIRCFMGSDSASRLFSEPDEQVLQVMQENLAHLLGISQQADQVKIYRWRHGLPQYAVGHFSRLRTIQALTGSGARLHCVGNYLDGVGVSDCIRHAQRVVGELPEAW